MNMELHPAPYCPEEFVNRAEELALIRKSIEQIGEGQAIDQPIVHFYGAPRIGKTWLLRHLAEQYKSPIPPSLPPTIVILVDCQTIAGAADVQSALLQACKVEIEEASEAQDLPTLVEVFKTLATQAVFLFLLDTAEVLQDKDFGWLETKILEPLVLTGRALIVVAGRAKAPRWRHFEMKRRVRYWTIRPFDLGMTVKQLRKIGLVTSAAKIYSYTHGHPYASRRLAEIPDPQKKAKVLQALEPVEAELLRHVPPDRSDLVRRIAVLRHFNIGTLRAFLSRLMGTVYAKKSDAFYTDLLGEGLGNPDWLFWDQQSRSYVFAPAVRHVLLARLRLADPWLYQESHSAALNLYERWWIDIYPQNSVRFLLEAIYHRTAIWELAEQDPEQLIRELDDLLKQRLTKSNFSTSQAVELEHTLREDQELQLPQAVLEWLLERCQKF
ncbi:MAG: hypothetical protein U9R05_03255 [Chloroflexota bacterium]|nr:hypothetical protein [Chloroflexota bacterium]